MYLITNDYRNVIRLKADIMTKSLQDYTKEELIEQIKSLKKAKKFGLVWEDKPEQVAIDCETKLPVLTEVTERAITKADNQPTNLIIEGDNYHSLSTLNYTHAGKIDVIYIDPPYNTGNKDFIYNDRYVDEEDGFRHSKWLSFMSKRLELAKSLLKTNGVMFISIDDNEQANLKLLCASIFGSKNVEVMIWNKEAEGKSGTLKQTLRFRTVHEYVLVVYRDKQATRFKQINEALEGREGEFQTANLAVNSKNEKTDHKNYFEITNPKGKKFLRQWKWDKPTIEKLAKDDLLYWGSDGNRQPRLIIPTDDRRQTFLLSILNYGGTTVGGKELNKILPDNEFSYPKPTVLISKLIESSSNDNATILDFFAGSGTTGQSVLELNKKDGGKRNFILCTNNENDIAENITYQRSKIVITGIRTDGTKYSKGVPANLRYFRTDFVDREDNTDQTRIALVARATDMIKVRENTFETVLEEDLLKAYEGADAYSVIAFDPSVIDKAKAEITKLSDDKAVRVYVFSLANDSYVSDFADLDRQVELCPIPESILEVYKRIFDQKGTK